MSYVYSLRALKPMQLKTQVFIVYPETVYNRMVAHSLSEIQGFSKVVESQDSMSLLT